MKDKIKNIKENMKNEKGALIVEAAIVFPVMFFVLLFIIFIGNIYFEQAKVDEIVMRYAIKGAECVADPFLYDMTSTGSITTDSSKTKLEPYRYIFGSFTDGSISSVESKISDAVKKEINDNGLVFFTNSKAKVTGTDNDSIAEFHNYIVYSTFVVQVNYKIKLPITFFGNDDLSVVRMSSRAEIPVSDTDEFIRNVDMAIDLCNKYGIGSSVKGLFDKINGFINKFS